MCSCFTGQSIFCSQDCRFSAPGSVYEKSWIRLPFSEGFCQQMTQYVPNRTRTIWRPLLASGQRAPKRIQLAAFARTLIPNRQWWGWILHIACILGCHPRFYDKPHFRRSATLGWECCSAVLLFFLSVPEGGHGSREHGSRARFASTLCTLRWSHGCGHPEGGPRFTGTAAKQTKCLSC
jgi:hypothetical protein